MKRRLVLVLTIGIFTALACNLPIGMTIDADPNPLRQTQAVEQTLRAELFPNEVRETPDASQLISDLGHPFPGLATAVPGSPTQQEIEQAEWVYLTQSGDTLPALAERFGVSHQEIGHVAPLFMEGLLPVGQELVIPVRLDSAFYSGALLPDSEVIFSASAKDFNVADYIERAGGYLEPLCGTGG